MASQPDTIDDKAEIRSAMETFARGFCHTRSRTHPYHCSIVEGVWRMRDDERKNARDYRREEWVAFDLDAKVVDRIVRKHTRGRFIVCAIRSMGQSMSMLRDEYKSIGYRLQGTEPFFIHDLKKIPTSKSPAKIERVRTPEMAAKLGKAQNMKPLKASDLKADSPIRQYVAMVDDRVVGWVSSIATGRQNWVSNLFVKHEFRRQGIARALMAKMLRDDRAAGVEGSALLASHAGAMLYPQVGYRQIAELLALNPPRK